MKGRPPGPSRALLKDQWGQWTAMIELFARRLPARRRVNPQSYRKLHQELIAICRSLAESADDKERAYYAELESLVVPWMSPRTLAQTDGEILGGLLIRCREVERQLGKRGVSPAAIARIIRILLVMMGLAVLFVVLWVAGIDPDPALGAVRGWSDTIWFAVKRSSDIQRLGVAAILVVFVSVYLVSRTARN